MVEVNKSFWDRQDIAEPSFTYLLSRFELDEVSFQFLVGFSCRLDISVNSNFLS